jgi:hypothetical protein
MKNEKIICQICFKETNFTAESFGRWHLRKCHNTSMQEYYNNFIKTESEGKCRVCGKPTKFISYRQGYRTFCSKQCASGHISTKTKRMDAKMIKYNNPTYNNRAQSQKTCVERYGVTNISKLDVIKNKKEETLLRNFGVSNMAHSPLIQSKRRQTIKSLYGVDNPSQVEKFKLKRMETTLRKYGELYYSRTEAYRQYQEEKGYWIPLEEKTAFELYFNQVWRETNKWKLQLFKEWNGRCYYTNVQLLTNKSSYNDALYAVIDHKVSIKYGFENNIPVIDIGALNNLCVCSRSINSIKNIKNENEFIKQLINLN